MRLTISLMSLCVLGTSVAFADAQTDYTNGVESQNHKIEWSSINEAIKRQGLDPSGMSFKEGSDDEHGFALVYYATNGQYACEVGMSWAGHEPPTADPGGTNCVSVSKKK